MGFGGSREAMRSLVGLVGGSRGAVRDAPVRLQGCPREGWTMLLGGSIDVLGRL